MKWYLLIFLWAAQAVLAQTGAGTGWWNQVDGATGIPCSYGPYTTQGGGPVSCWAEACCANQRQLSVDWTQVWQCGGTNTVTVSGDSDYVTTTGIDPVTGWTVFYNDGVRADGEADVHITGSYGWTVTEVFKGWDEEDCDGTTNYSGPYSYTC